ncbi:hypothetical protein [Salidesulfovibrio onnuriiensis]|uniref:hypothetical protein n=1 Tax=Salidesulfovibrio onnuriiensis TaxID=2583823 RepID=UPI0011C9D1B4|nr:hypothetical protein [Salidesulfovibrio onnuriiensis]
MPKYSLKEMTPQPEFDLWFYAELSGETRLDHTLVEEFGPRWTAWLNSLHAFHVENQEGAGSFLLIYLDKDVDEEIDHIWNDSPAFGLSFHNLAVCMVMTAAKSLIPELDEGRCAPLPRAGEGVREAVRDLGIEWNDQNTINRKFAVFTPYPYSGGCEICSMSGSCPNSTLQRQQ